MKHIAYQLQSKPSYPFWIVSTFPIGQRFVKLILHCRISSTCEDKMAPRDTVDRVEDQNLRLVRDYADGDNSDCSLCSKVSLPMNDCTQELEDKWHEFEEAATHGCRFCNLVYQCTRRHRRVLQVVPRKQIHHVIHGNGFHQVHTLRMPPLPRDCGAIWPYRFHPGQGCVSESRVCHGYSTLTMQISLHT